MKNIIKLNEISPLTSEVFKNDFKLVSSSDDAVAIMVRSYDMHDYDPPKSVLCVGRAGAGTNNIPVVNYAKKGIVVFNTPGANANAVKELVLCALLLSSRKIYQGINWTNSLSDGEKTVAEQVEKGKKSFVGGEIFGKTLGVYGLGAIGKMIASSAAALGMNVLGYDPYLPQGATIDGVTIVSERETLFSKSDYITFHVPFTNETKGLVNTSTIAQMKDGVKIINCSRGEIVDNQSIIAATESGKVSCYVTDFPCAEILGKNGIICIPHLGASTAEAEDNCAVMAAKEIVDYVENGNIINSVNFPKIFAERNGERTVVLFEGECSQEIQKSVSDEKINALNTARKNEFGVALIDSDKKLSEKTIEKIKQIQGVLKIRQI